MYWPFVLLQWILVQILCPFSFYWFLHQCVDVETLLYSECNFQSVTCYLTFLLRPRGSWIGEGYVFLLLSRIIIMDWYENELRKEDLSDHMSILRQINFRKNCTWKLKIWRLNFSPFTYVSGESLYSDTYTQI